MKKFETPRINISRFITEDIITTSGNGAEEKAVEGLTTTGSDLLNTRDAVALDNIVKFSF